LTKTTRSSRHNNPSADDDNNNNNNVDSSSDDKWLKSFYEDMGWKPLFYNWNKPTTNTTTTSSSFYKLLKQSTKSADKAEKLINKINTSQTLAINRLKSIPQNATIRSEYIKCGKAVAYTKHMDHTIMHIGKMLTARS
jgi:hypothetical protein